jgi:hypothetical protein
MALKVSKVEVWAVEMVDQPGGLAGALEPLAGTGASLECLIARRRPDKPGSGVAFITPVKGKKATEAARAAGWAPAGNIPTLRVEGPDKPGLGAKLLRAIGDAGVSVRGVSAAVLGRNFIAYIGLDSSEDADKAARAIKAADKAAARKPARR